MVNASALEERYHLAVDENGDHIWLVYLALMKLGARV